VNNQDVVYICYVLDAMAALNNEEVVSCLTVTQNIEVVGKWLHSQLNEAKENGFLPEESIEDCEGSTEFSLCVSKGNDTDGFESYFLVCRTELIE